MDIAARREEITANVARGLQAKAAEKGIVQGARGRSLNTLCAQTGLPQTNVYRAFEGSGEPTLSTVVLLAEALGCSIDELVKGPKEFAAKPKKKGG